MTQVSEALMRRIGKIKALAERGVDGEQATAKAMLNSILTRHNLTVDDIEEVKPMRGWVEVSYSGEHERDVLCQVIRKVTQQRLFYTKTPKRARSRFYVELSRVEHVEVEFIFELMRKALAEEFKKVTLAFIHANKLFAPPRDQDDDEGDEPDTRTPQERARMRQIAAMAMYMNPVQVNRAIETSKE